MCNRYSPLKPQAAARADAHWRDATEDRNLSREPESPQLPESVPEWAQPLLLASESVPVLESLGRLPTPQWGGVLPSRPARERFALLPAPTAFTWPP